MSIPMETKTASFTVGEDLHLKFYQAELNCMYLDKNYLPLLLVIYSLHSCEISSIESELDDLRSFISRVSNALFSNSYAVHNFPLMYMFYPTSLGNPNLKLPNIYPNKIKLTLAISIIITIMFYFDCLLLCLQFLKSNPGPLRHNIPIFITLFSSFNNIWETVI